VDTPRLTAAAVGVSRKMAEVLNQASAQWEPRLLAGGAVDGRHAAPGRLHRDCPRCHQVLALGRVRNALDWTASPR
jgi:hypothetical protein